METDLACVRFPDLLWLQIKRSWRTIEDISSDQDRVPNEYTPRDSRRDRSSMVHLAPLDRIDESSAREKRVDRNPRKLSLTERFLDRLYNNFVHKCICIWYPN
jgi:hypothetical protein